MSSVSSAIPVTQRTTAAARRPRTLHGSGVALHTAIIGSGGALARPAPKRQLHDGYGQH